MSMNHNWLDAIAQYVPFVLSTNQHVRTSFKSVIEAIIIAAIGGAMGTAVAFYVLRAEFSEFRKQTEAAIVRIDKVLDKQEGVDDRLRDRLHEVEKAQARSEGPKK